MKADDDGGGLLDAIGGLRDGHGRLLNGGGRLLVGGGRFCDADGGLLNGDRRDLFNGWGSNGQQPDYGSSLRDGGGWRLCYGGGQQLRDGDGHRDGTRRSLGSRRLHGAASGVVLRRWLLPAHRLLATDDDLLLMMHRALAKRLLLLHRWPSPRHWPLAKVTERVVVHFRLQLSAPLPQLSQAT